MKHFTRLRRQLHLLQLQQLPQQLQNQLQQPVNLAEEGLPEGGDRIMTTIMIVKNMMTNTMMKKKMNLSLHQGSLGGNRDHHRVSEKEELVKICYGLSYEILVYLFYNGGK